MKKRYKKSVIIYIVISITVMTMTMIVTGCGTASDSARNTGSGSKVGDVLKSQMKDQDNTGEQDQKTENGIKDNQNDKTNDPDSGNNEKTSDKDAGVTAGNGSVDIDLTQMSSDMVYATVYQMVMDPNQYIGKTFKIKGLYCVAQEPKTGAYYQYCLVQDALACCAQGLEFVWGDGSHVYPDDYPPEETEITVQGTFETYKEPGDDTLYSRLANATMTVG